MSESEYRTRCREFGPIRFIAPWATDQRPGFVWIELANGVRAQICHGGLTHGDAIRAYPGLDLALRARSWLKRRREWRAAEGT